MKIGRTCVIAYTSAYFYGCVIFLVSELTSLKYGENSWIFKFNVESESLGD